MSCTVEEAIAAANARYQRRSRAERAWGFRLMRFSHRTCMDFYHDRNEDDEDRMDPATALLHVHAVSGGNRSLTLHDLGIQPPTSDRKSKRKRGDAPKKTARPEDTYLST